MSAALGLLMNILLARILSVSNYGLIALGFAWLQILATFACFGSDTVSVRFIAEANAKNEISKISDIMLWGRNTTLNIGWWLSILSCLLIYFIFNEYSYVQLIVLYIIIISTPLVAFGLNRSGVLRGFKKVLSAAFVEKLLNPLFGLIILSGVAFLYNWSPSVIAVSISILIANLCMALIGNYLAQRVAPSNTLSTNSDDLCKKWLKMAKPIVFMNIVVVLIGNMDTVLIGYFIDSSSAGVYRASAQLANLVSFGLAASNGIMAPLIAEYYSKGQLFDLQKILRFSVALVSILGICTILVMGFCGNIALGLFGVEYLTGSHTLFILLVSQSINALCGPTGILMAMTGHQLHAAKMFAISAFISATLNIILIPLYGTIGAAVANVAGNAIWNILILIYLKTQLNLDPSILGWFLTKNDKKMMPPKGIIL